MKVKSIKIGAYSTDNNVFLAPLAGFSDSAMREICLSYGAGLTFTEMVSAKGLIYGDEKTTELLRPAKGEKLKAAQIFGSDPVIMRRAIEETPLSSFDIIDINFGCPMPKIYLNGDGSALLAAPNKAEKIVAECKKSGKPITAKMRIGLTREKIVGVDFAKALEQGGADMITVHGRTREQIYAGEVDFEEIAKIKNAVKVPVIANGGVFSVGDAETLISSTGADGIMLARGALEKPWLFSEILGLPVCVDKKQLIFRHIDLLKEVYPDKVVAKLFRKQLCLYLKGEKNANTLKNKILTLTDTDEVKKELNEFF